MSKYTTLDYSNLLNGRLPNSDLEFELADMLLDKLRGQTTEEMVEFIDMIQTFDKPTMQQVQKPFKDLVIKFIKDDCTDEERVELFQPYCKSCGTFEGDFFSCQCMNDE